MTLPVHWLPALTTDGWLLFATYSVRLVAYGFVSVVLGLPFLAAGSIKLVYDAALLLLFRGVHPPEERVSRTDRR